MPQFRSESSVAAAALSPRTFGRRPDRATVVCAPTDRYFVVKVRRGGAGTPVGAPGFQPQTAVDHRGLRPKLRSNTAISNRKLRSADRNFGRSPLFPTATSVAKTATAARICFERGAGLSPCARNTMREEIGRDTSSSQHAGHAVRRNRTRSAAGTFSGHRQRSRRICHQKCGCRVSPTTSGSSTPRDRACSSTSRSSSERLGQPLFWWQILRLRWR